MSITLFRASPYFLGCCWQRWMPFWPPLLPGKNKRKAARPSGGVVSLNPRRWRGKRLHHHGGGVCWLFLVLLWMDLWHHKTIVCKNWYKNNLLIRLSALLCDPHWHAPYHPFALLDIVDCTSEIDKGGKKGCKICCWAFEANYITDWRNKRSQQSEDWPPGSCWPAAFWWC